MMYRMKPWLVMLACACGHPPAAKAPAPELPAGSAADLAGRYSASDELDFGYVLTIGADGSFDLWIDRNKLGRCEEKGTLSAGATPKTFALTYKVNECHRDAVGATEQVTVESHTQDQLVLVIGAERHVFSVSGGAASTRRS